jgi:DNA repair protein RecN (Recombination protein N)
MAVLDSYCGQNELFKQYQSGFRRFQKLQRELEEMKKLEARSRGEMDYFIFLLDELRKASLRAGEQEELERRIEILSHAEDIKGSLYASADRLGRSEVNVISLLNEVAQLLAQASRHHPAVSDLLSRIRNNQIDLKDLLKETEKLEEEVQFDPGELSEATARLDLIYGLEKKHQVRTVEELISISSDIENKIVRDGNLEQKINEMEQELSVQHKALRASATSLSLARKNGIKGFEKEVSDRLVQTGMPSAVFRVEVLPTEELGGGGIDTVRFLFSANKGVGPSEISRVASGGELSRLMLSIKSMISRRNLLPTVIFDEIDSGVSGDIAGKVGAIMKKMSAEMQVIAITHLPQIAGKGDHHFCVFKKEVRNVTATQIMKLGQKERVEEIAKMMSNEVVTQAAIRAAKELLN